MLPACCDCHECFDVICSRFCHLGRMRRCQAKQCAHHINGLLQTRMTDAPLAATSGNARPNAWGTAHVPAAVKQAEPSQDSSSSADPIRQVSVDAVSISSRSDEPVRASTVNSPLAENNPINQSASETPRMPANPSAQAAPQTASELKPQVSTFGKIIAYHAAISVSISCCTASFMRSLSTSH